MSASSAAALRAPDAVCAGNLIIVSIDDCIAHLLLFWVVMMPAGRTLSWRGRSPTWREDKTPASFVVQLATSNVALLWFVAGVTKWWSAMWLEGRALHAILRLPIAWQPDIWDAAELQPWLKAATWA